MNGTGPINGTNPMNGTDPMDGTRPIDGTNPMGGARRNRQCEQPGLGLLDNGNLGPTGSSLGR